MIAISVLLFASAVVAADVRPATRVVVCGEEGCRRTAPDRPPPAGTFDHGWVWSDACSPERADAKALDATVQRVSRGACVRSAAFNVEVLGASRNEAVSIRFGPVSMWREVDETLLPAVTLPENIFSASLVVPAGESWRARAVTPTKGSWWADGRAGTAGRIDLFPARLRHVAVSDGKNRLRDARASVVQAAGGRRRPEVLAVLTGNDRGELAFDRIPAFEEISIVVSARGHAPAVIKGTAATLIGDVTLTKGESVAGRVVRTEKGQVTAVADAAVTYEAWLEGASVVFRRQVLSSADGRFTIGSVPPGHGVIIIRRSGLATTTRDVDVQGAPVVLDDVLLTAESSLQVRVRDDRGSAVAGATIACEGVTAQTNARGIGIVRSLRVDEATTLTVKAPRHLGKSVKVNAPLPRSIDVDLSRAFELTGTFVTKDATPLSGDLLVHVGTTDTVDTVEEKGFAIAVPPDVDAVLTFLSRDALPFRAEVATGAAGGGRDLGALVVDTGVRVRGVVRSRLDGKPVHGARVWMPRPTAEGPLVAWMRMEILETRSDAEGHFVLGGLGIGAATLRIDAPGCARAYATVSVDGSTAEAGTSDVLVGPGAIVRVEGSGEIVRVDPRGDSLDFDFVTAPIVAGAATLLHIPSGSMPLQVLRDRTVLCEKHIEVEGDGSEMSVRCDAPGLHVAGRVRAGEEPVREGRLTWSSGAASLHSAIMTRRSPAGAMQQDAYGAGGSVVLVPVKADGSFETDELRPGTWEVVWSGGGATAASRPVVVPDGVSSFAVDLVYPATTLTGDVLDRDGRPAAAALVREEGGGRAVAVTDAEGHFAIAGIGAGFHEFRARRTEEESEIVGVEIDPSRRPDPHVTLKLGPASADIRVSVTAGGVSLANAFVLAEDDRGASSLTTTDVDGRASIPSDAAARLVRFAVYSVRGWHFGSWKPRSEIAGVVQIGIAATGGTLAIRAATATAPPVILDPHGWDVTRILREVGIFSRLPLEISGLPAGVYTVISGTTQTAAVRDRERTEMELR